MEKKAAFIAVVGRPSAGKSTLVNRICGRKVAIISSVPQTTRNAIRGILTNESGQLVFVDTPGRHASEKKLNKKLMDVSDHAIDDCELVLYVIDAARPPGPEELSVARRILPLCAMTAVVVNKMDLPSAEYERAQRFLEENLPDIPRSKIFKISSLNGEGIDALLASLFEMAPAGEPMYPEDIYTDQEIPFRIAEIIREKAINRLREELPHSIYVEVADMELREEANTLWVRAFIVTERESQKGMVVGKGGQMIKAIRLSALKDLKEIFDWKIDLDLRVKTGKDWRHNDRILHKVTDI